MGLIGGVIGGTITYLGLGLFFLITGYYRGPAIHTGPTEISFILIIVAEFGRTFRRWRRQFPAIICGWLTRGVGPRFLGRGHLLPKASLAGACSGI
jgi:hypothetical protein